MTLEQKVLDQALINLPDWQVAEILTNPDPNLPAIVEWKSTQIGIGSVMLALGPAAGADFLDSLENMAQQNNTIKWALKVLENSNLDLGEAEVRQQILALSQNPTNILTETQVEQLFSLSRRTRYPSWAEFNNIHVDARAVGLARGAKP